MFNTIYLNGVHYSLIKLENKAIYHHQSYSGPPNPPTMKYATVEDIIASFPHPVLPSVPGEPDYHSLHATHKMLQANARSIDTHLGGRSFGHLSVIISDIAYEGISPLTAWVNPPFPGRDPSAIWGGGTAAQISAAKHRWEEATTAFKTYSTVQSALKKTDHNGG
jgi:hypothetical protein